MKIRFAQQKDKENVLALLDELITEANKRMGSPNIHSGDENRYSLYEDILKRDDIKIFVAEENEKLVGVAEFFIVPHLIRGYYQGVIETFVITHKMRGKGMGSALIKEIFNFCKKNNIPVIKVSSGIELTDAHKFYEKHGGRFTEKLFRIDLK
jgi:GNAT superfamily N-acetyltransferase